MQYEINKEIVFSTAHITLEDSVKLNKWKDLSTTVERLHYGWRILIIDGVVETVKDDGLSAALGNLVSIAKDQGCKWLVLDCDGPVIDELPKFDW